MAAQLFYMPFSPVFTSRGLPAGAAMAYFYLSGTTTPAPIYADGSLTIQLPNPVTAGALGNLPDIYLNSATSYRVRIVDALGAPLGADIDPYIPGTAGSSASQALAQVSALSSVVDRTIKVPVGEIGSVTEAAGTRANRPAFWNAFGALASTSWQVIASAILPYLPATLIGPKGDPGGNVLSVGLFSALASLTIPAGTALIQTSGGTRGLLYEDTSLTDASVTAYPFAVAKTANGRYFRRDPRDLWFEQFGAIGDGATNNNTAFDAAFAYADFCARIDAGPLTGYHYKGAPTLRLGIGSFLVSKSFNLHSTHRILGQAQGIAGGQGATVIVQTVNTHVFIVNRPDTDNYLYTTNYGGGADGTEIAHIAFRYTGPNTQADRGFASGSAIASHAAVNVHDNFFEGYPGPALQVRASVDGTGASRGQASCCYIRRNIFTACFIGYWNTGSDSNVQEVANNTFSYNDRWGVLADQALSCTFINNHFSGNGAFATYSYNGSLYSCMPGQETAASTTAPGTNPAVWGLISATPTGTFAWVSGITVIAGGSVAHTNRNARSVFLGNYLESGQGLPVIQFPAMSFGGQWGHHSGCDGVYVGGEQGSLLTRSLQIAVSTAPGSVLLDPTSGIIFNNPATAGPSSLVVGARGNGFRLGLGQSDSGTGLYVHGPADANPGWIDLARVLLPGPFPDNATAISVGLKVGQPYFTSTGTVLARV